MAGRYEKVHVDECMSGTESSNTYRTLRPAKARSLIEAAKASGRVFSVLFVKRSNGELRRMVCRGGVKAHLKGGDQTYDPAEHKLAVVFDMQKSAYRSIALDAVVEVAHDGKVD